MVAEYVALRRAFGFERDFFTASQAITEATPSAAGAASVMAAVAAGRRTDHPR